MRKPLSTLADRWDGYSLNPELHVCSMPETTQPTVDRILAAIPPDANRVLDLGCGPGRLAVRVADARPTLDVVALDISPAMLARAAYHPRVRYLLGDGETIPGGGRYDSAWSVLLFQHLPVGAVTGYLFSLAARLMPAAPLVVQFIAGDYHLDLDHRYKPTEMVGLAEAAGFVDVTATQAVADDWWWLTARAPT
jgi:trans-aconitate methyltransferase